MKNLTTFSHFLSGLLLTAMVISTFDLLAQSGREQAVLQFHTDQNVYVVGEEIWVEGRLPASVASLPFFTVQLIDRKGNGVAAVNLAVSDRYFSGYLTVPGEVASDYYFLDGLASGIQWDVQLLPLLVINPELRPAAGCLPESESADTKQIIQETSRIQLSRQRYEFREPVKASLQLPEGGVSAVSIVVKRKDQLSEQVEVLQKRYPLLRKHDSAGLLENEGHHWRIRLVDKKTGRPASGKMVYATTLGSQTLFDVAQTDPEGQAVFLLPRITGEANLLFTVAEDLQEQTRMEIKEEAKLTQPVDFPCLSLSEVQKKDIEERVFNARMSHRLGESPVVESVLAEADTTDFYGNPDRSYLLDDYTRFPNMQEILSEFVPEVRVRKVGEAQPVIQILNTPSKAFFAEPGLILLDGLPVFSSRTLLNLDPLLLRSIDVISHRFFSGSFSFNGILQYKSYKKDLAGYPLPGNAVIQYFKGLQPRSVPRFQDKTRLSSRLPYLRNLLWHTVLSPQPGQSSTQVEFFTGDASGLYQIEVRFVNNRGEEEVSTALITIEQEML